VTTAAAAAAAGGSVDDDDRVCRVDETAVVELVGFSGLLSTSATATTLVAELHDDADGDAVPHLNSQLKQVE